MVVRRVGVHGRYERRLMGAGIGGRVVGLRLVVRRFFCDNLRCPKKTFVEQVDGLTARFDRQSVLVPQLETLAW